MAPRREFRRLVESVGIALGEASTWAAACVKAYCASLLVTKYVNHITITDGASMFPTMNPFRTVFMVNCLPGTTFTNPVIQWVLPRKWCTFERGDVVLVKAPHRPATVDGPSLICKRILAMEGDLVHPPPASDGTAMPATVVPQGHVWLAGDNLDNSIDSRVYGPVPLALVVGRMWFRCWPWSEAGPFTSETPLQLRNAYRIDTVSRPYKGAGASGT